MIIIYETRSFSEARTMESFIRLVYAATALFVVLYFGLPTSSYIALFFFALFLLFLLILLKNLVIQIFRTRLKPTTWKIDIENNSIKYGTLPWKFTFKNIKAFYVPESKSYVEFIMNRKYCRIWRSKIDQNEYLFISFVEALEDASAHSHLPLEIPTLGETRRKAVFYSFTPYIVMYIVTMLLFPSLYKTLQEENHMVSSFILTYMIIAFLTTRILFLLNIQKILKSGK